MAVSPIAYLKEKKYQEFKEQQAQQKAPDMNWLKALTEKSVMPAAQKLIQQKTPEEWQRQQYQNIGQQAAAPYENIGGQMGEGIGNVLGVVGEHTLTPFSQLSDMGMSGAWDEAIRERQQAQQQGASPDWGRILTRSLVPATGVFDFPKPYTLVRQQLTGIDKVEQDYQQRMEAPPESPLYMGQQGEENPLEQAARQWAGITEQSGISPLESLLAGFTSPVDVATAVLPTKFITKPLQAVNRGLGIGVNAAEAATKFAAEHPVFGSITKQVGSAADDIPAGQTAATMEDFGRQLNPPKLFGKGDTLTQKFASGDVAKAFSQVLLDDRFPMLQAGGKLKELYYTARRLPGVKALQAEIRKRGIEKTVKAVADNLGNRRITRELSDWMKARSMMDDYKISGDKYIMPNQTPQKIQQEIAKKGRKLTPVDYMKAVEKKLDDMTARGEIKGKVKADGTVTTWREEFESLHKAFHGTAENGFKDGMWWKYKYQPAIDNGLMTENQAIKQMEARPNYYPLERTTGFSNSVRTSAERSTEGSAREIASVLNTTLDELENARFIAEQNNLRRKAGHAIKEMFGTEIQEGSDAAELVAKSRSGEATNVLYWLDTKAKDGTPLADAAYFAMEHNDPDLIKAITMFDDVDHKIVKFVSTMLGVPALRKMATTWNAMFLPKNITRDVNQAWARVGILPTSPKYKEAMGMLLKLKNNPEMLDDPRFQAIAKVWGSNFQASLSTMPGKLGILDRIKDIKQLDNIFHFNADGTIVFKESGFKKLLHPLETLDSTIQTLESLNSFMELSVKMAAYLHIEDLYKAAQAGQDNWVAKAMREGEKITPDWIGTKAAESTVDFQRAGELGRVLNMVIPFFNANIQGTALTIGRAISNPKAALIYSTIHQVPELASYYYNEHNYPGMSAKIPLQLKLDNTVFILGTYMTSVDPMNPELGQQEMPIILAIPKSQPWKFATQGTTQVLAAMDEKQRERLGKDIGGTVMANLVDLASSAFPFDVTGQSKVSGGAEGIMGGLANVALSTAPPAIRTGTELLLNKASFSGGNIVPQYLANQPKQDQYTANTNPFFIAMAPLLNTVGLSPIQAEYASKQIGAVIPQLTWFGGLLLGMTGYDPVGTGAERRPEKADAQKVSASPLGAFVKTPANAEVDMYYDDTEKARIKAQEEINKIPGMRELGVTLSATPRTFTRGSKDVLLTEEQGVQLTEMRSQLAQSALKELSTQSWWKMLPTKEKADQVTKIMTKASNTGGDLMQRQINGATINMVKEKDKMVTFAEQLQAEYKKDQMPDKVMKRNETRAEYDEALSEYEMYKALVNEFADERGITNDELAARRFFAQNSTARDEYVGNMSEAAWQKAKQRFYSWQQRKTNVAKRMENERLARVSTTDYI